MKKVAAVLFLVASSLMAQSDNPNLPTKGHIEALAPEPVPQGSCTADTFGYLDQTIGDTYRPDTPAELGNAFATYAKMGYVVTFYPQPGGKFFVVATCQKASK